MQCALTILIEFSLSSAKKIAAAPDLCSELDDADGDSQFMRDMDAYEQGMAVRRDEENIDSSNVVASSANTEPPPPPPPPYAQSLDPYQRSAALEDPCCRRIVMAAAGSGKTTTTRAAIQHTIATVLAPHQLPLSCILVLSFSRAAKHAMTQSLEAEGVAGIDVRTFHSLAIVIVNMFRADLARILRAKEVARFREAPSNGSGTSVKRASAPNASGAASSSGSRSAPCALPSSSSSSSSSGSDGNSMRTALSGSKRTAPSFSGADLGLVEANAVTIDPAQPMTVLTTKTGVKLLEACFEDWDFVNEEKAQIYMRKAGEARAAGGYCAATKGPVPVTPRQRAKALFELLEQAKALMRPLPSSVQRSSSGTGADAIWASMCGDVYHAFTAECRRNNFMTFADSLLYCLDLLRYANREHNGIGVRSGSRSSASSNGSSAPLINPSVSSVSPLRHYIAGRWAFILSDEAQDTSRLQHEILRELAAATLLPTDAAGADTANSGAVGSSGCTAAAEIGHHEYSSPPLSPGRVREVKSLLTSEGKRGPFVTLVGDEGAWITTMASPVTPVL